MTPTEFGRFVRGAKEREKDAWRQTAYIVEVLVNVNRKKGTPPKRASQIFPWAFLKDSDD